MSTTSGTDRFLWPRLGKHQESRRRMRRVFISGLLAGASCLAQEPFDRVLQLARTRQKMVQSLTHLPDFTCMATMQRVVRGPRDRGFRPLDTIRFEIAHQGHTELWSWPGAANFQDTPLTSMVKNGTIGDGDFALHAKAVFMGSANIKFIGPVDLEGRATLQWDFTIPVFGSGWKITSGGGSIVVGASGSFWADAETLDLARLDIRATDLPFGFPITSVEQSIDYARTQIGSASVLLPQTAALFMEDVGGEKRNITEFSHCRQYSGSAEISFAEAAPAGAAMPEPVKASVVKPTEVSLPAGLRVRIKLKSSIDSQSAIVGDPIQAIIESDIGERGKVLVPKGALITGRLRRVERHGAEFFVVGIEYDDIEFPGHHARFAGSIKNMESDVPEFQWFHKTSTTTETLDTRVTKGQVFHLEEVSGVGTFIMNGARFRLAAGTVMVWETE
jgi:hypothetical protein